MHHFTEISTDRLQELTKADREGRLHISPCQDGTNIFVIVVEGMDDGIAGYPKSARVEKDTYIHGHTEYMHGEINSGFWLSFDSAYAELNKKCRVCGCSWDHACEGGCYWVGDDLCSRCAQMSLEDTKKVV